MLPSKYAICRKRSRFVKKQEASRILSSVGLKTPLSKTLLFGDILLYVILLNHYKIYEIVNKFLLAEKQNYAENAFTTTGIYI